jgi:hypothetical protein
MLKPKGVVARTCLAHICALLYTWLNQSHQVKVTKRVEAKQNCTATAEVCDLESTEGYMVWFVWGEKWERQRCHQFHLFRLV